jgi:hypothetical protein
MQKAQPLICEARSFTNSSAPARSRLAFRTASNAIKVLMPSGIALGGFSDHGVIVSSLIAGRVNTIVVFGGEGNHLGRMNDREAMLQAREVLITVEFGVTVFMFPSVVCVGKPAAQLSLNNQFKETTPVQ